ncbi:hypothetical protein XA67_21415 [Comamonas thiooxydans]|nr:hypothetical protein XA67_21415 [Comamonas thiooxydans]
MAADAVGGNTGRTIGQDAILNAKQDCNVVAFATKAFFLPGQDFSNKAVALFVFTSPLSNRDTLVLKP